MEDTFWQAYMDRGVQVIGVDVWNDPPSAIQSFVSGGGRNITFPIGMNAGGLYRLDRHSFVIVGADGIIEYISPQSTPYTQRLNVHQSEMLSKLEELLSVSSIEEPPTPAAFQLYQNSPNPVRFDTVIRFDLKSNTRNTVTELVIYDMLGRKVRTLVASSLQAATYRYHWSGRDDRGQTVARGVYFYALTSGNLRTVRKLLYLGN